MQFLERNSFNLRSAIYKFKHDEHMLEFMLFPMVHVGEPEYYEQINGLLGQCQQILYEGVQSKISTIVTFSYRLLAENKDIGLIDQGEGLKLRELNAELFHADMSQELFEMEWTKIPFRLRLMILLAAPIIGIFNKFFGGKEILAFGGNVDDLPGARDGCSDDNPFSELIVTKRDRVLIQHIEEHFQSNKSKKLTVGIIYGARHMPAIVRLLSIKLKYRVSDSSWVTVASFV